MSELAPSWERYAYPVDVAAQMICRSKYTLYEAIKRGDLRAVRTGPKGEMVILNEDLKAWLNLYPVQPEQDNATG